MKVLGGRGGTQLAGRQNLSNLKAAQETKKSLLPRFVYSPVFTFTCHRSHWPEAALPDEVAYWTQWILTIEM